MTDGNWDELRERIAEEYNLPPDTRAEEMWRVISRDLPPVDGSRQARVRRWPRYGPVAALAASLILAVGYGLGRWTAPAGSEGPQPVDALLLSEQPVTAATATEASRNAYRFAAARHLAASGSFLGRVRDDVQGGVVADDAGEWARDLLTETRLILDSPALDETELRILLEDLELLLVQIAHAAGAQQSGASDLGRIEIQQLTRGMDQNDLLPRIQRLIPPMLSADSQD